MLWHYLNRYIFKHVEQVSHKVKTCGVEQPQMFNLGFHNATSIFPSHTHVALFCAAENDISVFMNGHLFIDLYLINSKH